MTNSATTLLATLQLADSFFPSGMYTQSHGLERFVSAGVRGEEQIRPLLESYLLHVAARNDALAARWTVRAAQQNDLELLIAIDQRLEATKLSTEGRAASRRCGKRLAALGIELQATTLIRDYVDSINYNRTPGHQAIALALLAASTGVDEESAVLSELHSFMISLIGAAVRLGALDHIAAQRLLRQAHPLMIEAAQIGQTLDWRDLGGFAPLIDLAQFQHRYDELHMFVS